MGKLAKGYVDQSGRVIPTNS
jgi:hypothetical protein